MGLESRHGRRRRLTETIARRRRSDFIHRCLDGDSSGHLWTTSPYYWAKNSTDPCRCAKRRHGVPRLGKGMCCIGERSRIYRLRAQALELKRLIRRGADLDGDDVALLSRALVRPT